MAPALRGVVRCISRSMEDGTETRNGKTFSKWTNLPTFILVAVTGELGGRGWLGGWELLGHYWVTVAEWLL